MKTMARFNNLRLVHTQPNMIGNRLDLRIYVTDVDEAQVRYHVGLPVELLPLSAWVFAESETYMGEKHWDEQDGFYVYWLTVLAPVGSPVPFAEIQTQLDFMMRQLNKALSFLRTAGMNS